jgi:dienelactone hydrolase
MLRSQRQGAATGTFCSDFPEKSGMDRDIQVRETLIGDIREVNFWFRCGGELVPGVAYLPTGTDELLPMVQIQHPGMGSKEDYWVSEVGQRWAKRGWVCVGLDAPLHGERQVHDPLALFRDPSRYEAVRAQFAAEVARMLDLLPGVLPIDVARLGYVGYSLGSMLGVAAVARSGRFKAAAFCLVGEGGLAGPATGPDSDVARLGTVAVRVVGKTADELIPRERTEALFAALPGEKDLQWLPGGHFEIGPDVVKLAEQWMAEKL